MGYERVWRIQHTLVERRIAREIGDVLILVEHDHVFTLGRKGDERNILDRTVPVYRVERGGDATYHGPGQLVAYPIIDLNERGIGVKEFVKLLEDTCIGVLKRLGVEASSIEGKPGVWVGGRKIASIGLAIRHWVSFHGLAFNINPDMSYFHKIRPCGMESQLMTSLAQLMAKKYTLEEIKPLFKEEFAKRIKSNIVDASLEEVLGEGIKAL